MEDAYANGRLTQKIEGVNGNCHPSGRCPEGTQTFVIIKVWTGFVVPSVVPARDVPKGQRSAEGMTPVYAVLSRFAGYRIARQTFVVVKAWTGIEPVYAVLQTAALPLGYQAITYL